MKNHSEKLVDLIAEIAKGGTRYAVFNDFCKIYAAAISNRFDFNRQRENLYLETVKKYERDLVSKFVEASVELNLALEDCIGQKVLRLNSPQLEELGLFTEFPLKCSNPRYKDVLGGIFTEFNMNDSKEGQVFTPEHVGNIMGDLTLDKNFVEAQLKAQGFILIKENCCGSGAITFGALNTLLNLGVSPNKQAVVVASDVDERCIFMAYIQLSLYGIPAVVVQRDDSSGKVFGEPWYTPLFVKDDWLNKFDWRDNFARF
ncbi:MAG: hypothetical protein IJT73_08095 [Selenomonadaceae bacterium]|nr:hypothetical protein [Selenomonadaceae bacterium]